MGIEWCASSSCATPRMEPSYNEGLILRDAGMLQLIIMISLETQCAHFAEGDHMVSLGDDVQDVVWTPRGAMGKHERLWRT